MSFGFSNAPAIVEVTCETPASVKNIWGQLEGTKAYHCPKDCSKIKHNVYNNKFEYHYSSSVCQAAIHSGILTDMGGAISLKYKDPISLYFGTFNAGINGQRMINGGLQGLSFTIHGSKEETTEYFVDVLQTDSIS